MFIPLAKLEERCCSSALLLRLLFVARRVGNATLENYSRVEEKHTLSISRRHRSESSVRCIVMNFTCGLCSRGDTKWHTLFSNPCSGEANQRCRVGGCS